MSWEREKASCVVTTADNRDAEPHVSKIRKDTEDFIFFAYVFNLSCCVYYVREVHICHLCGGQRAAFRNWLSPSTLWVLGTELRQSGLEATEPEPP